MGWRKVFAPELFYYNNLPYLPIHSTQQPSTTKSVCPSADPYAYKTPMLILIDVKVVFNTMPQKLALIFTDTNKGFQ